MDENLPEKTNQNLLPTLTASQGLIVTSQIKILNAKNSEIIIALKYVMTLLGIPANKVPGSLEMTLMINYMRMHMGGLFVDEIRIAFDLAVAGKLRSQKKGDPHLDLGLYGSTLSMRYIADILKAYVEYKKPVMKALQDTSANMNNYDRAKGVLEILSQKPEMLAEIRKIGVEKPRVDLPPLPHHDIHQRWMRQFDKLRIKWGRPTSGGTFIERYGYIMNLEGFFNKKAEQLQMWKERNADVI